MKPDDDLVRKAKEPPQNAPKGPPIEPIWEGYTGVIIATGPSLTDEQLRLIAIAQVTNRVKVFTINNTFERFPQTDLQLSCDGPWWRYYWPRSELLRSIQDRCWSWYPDIAEDYGINYIKAIVKDGLSTDPAVIHINHGSGPMMLNIAYHFGIRRVLLLGHDMTFAKDYDPRRKFPGSTPRHYFGEYPKVLQHWPSVKIREGLIWGLIEAYEKMPVKEMGYEVINVTPGSHLPTFPMMDLHDAL